MKNDRNFDLAIIDNRIKKDLLSFDAKIVCFKYSRESDSIEEIPAEQLDNDVGCEQFTHATKCIACIPPKEGQLISIANICVIENGKGGTAALFAALKWVAEYQIPIIHLSIGTCEIRDSYYLRPIVRHILNNDQLIVAAQSNNCKYTFPANIAGVVSVGHQVCNSHQLSGEHCELTKPQIQIDEKLRANFRAPFYTQPLNSCNSFAAALVTSRLLSPYIKFHNTSVLRMFLYHAYPSMIFRQGLTPDFVKEYINIDNKHTTDIIKQTHRDNGKEPCISVLIHSPDAQKVMEQLLLLSKIKKILGIVFCFPQKVPLNLQTLCLKNGWLMWSEHNHLNALSSVACKSSQPLPIPCINVWGKGTASIPLAHRLSNLFIKRNYQALVASNIPDSYLWGCLYFNDQIFSNAVSVLNSSVLQLSILIIASQKPFLSADISVPITKLEKNIHGSLCNLVNLFIK